MGLCVAVLLKDTGSRSELKALLDGQPGLQQREVGAGGIEPEQVVELNPALQRQARQRQMATWLLPFGFGAGMVFTFITNLDTISLSWITTLCCLVALHATIITCSLIPESPATDFHTS